MIFHAYRLYRNEKAEYNYLLSIVASEYDVRYVIPTGKFQTMDIFNDDRIRSLLSTTNASELPKTIEEWVDLAIYNTGRSNFLDLTPVDISENLDFVLRDEQAYADATAEKYAYLEEL